MKAPNRSSQSPLDRYTANLERQVAKRREVVKKGKVTGSVPTQSFLEKISPTKAVGRVISAVGGKSTPARKPSYEQAQRIKKANQRYRDAEMVYRNAKNAADRAKSKGGGGGKGGSW